ncbi:hypothetical protein P8452_59901 [Trifolium repens]|nr:hypothetical protein P8452_59901 [Trifolium repens]
MILFVSLVHVVVDINGRSNSLAFAPKNITRAFNGIEIKCVTDEDCCNQLPPLPRLTRICRNGYCKYRMLNPPRPLGFS